MLSKISKDTLIGNGPIQMFFPGIKLNNNDTGLASIGRIDHANFKGDNIIKMHPHINDEILTYLRIGYIEHIDSEGNSAKIDNTKLMLMKAGKLFHHEEKIIDKGESFEALQIFIRPKTKDLNPVVTFHELKSPFSLNKWRLLASPSEDTDLQFTSDTWIYDFKTNTESKFQLPKLAKDNLTCILYIFNGSVIINDEIKLSKKDSLLIKDENIDIITDKNTELVLFVTDENSEYYDQGMFSGNQI